MYGPGQVALGNCIGRVGLDQFLPQLNTAAEVLSRFPLHAEPEACLGQRQVGKGKDGAEAVSLAKELQPDLVVMDIAMPRMNGVDAMKAILAAKFRTRSRAEWCARLEGSDACFAPVLSMAEAASHPHNQARHAFIEVGGVTQPAPAPRFPGSKTAPPRPPGSVDARETLAAFGLSAAEIGAILG